MLPEEKNTVKITAPSDKIRVKSKILFIVTLSLLELLTRESKVVVNLGFPALGYELTDWSSNIKGPAKF